MPEVSRFFGIVIRMYFDENNPRISTPSMQGMRRKSELIPSLSFEGKLPNRAASMVREWAALHQQDLMHNWHRLRNDQPTERIDPLE